MRAFVCLCLLVGFLSAAPIGAQSLPMADASALPHLEDERQENPLLRFEIVSLGSFPITLFYSDFGFDLQRWLAKGNDMAYAPWPLKVSNSAPLSDSERLTRLGAALGASLIIGTVDAIIHAGKVKAAKRLREARSASSP